MTTDLDKAIVLGVAVDVLEDLPYRHGATIQGLKDLWAFYERNRAYEVPVHDDWVISAISRLETIGLEGYARAVENQRRHLIEAKREISQLRQQLDTASHRLEQTEDAVLDRVIAKLTELKEEGGI